jgi:hypothetical protein
MRSHGVALPSLCAAVLILGSGAHARTIWAAEGEGPLPAPAPPAAAAATAREQGIHDAIELALRWLHRTQRDDGSWDIGAIAAACPEAKVEPDGREYGGSIGIAHTAFAAICFLRAGYDHRSANPYRDTVKKALTSLLSAQGADGAFGTRNYEHAIAIMALAEAATMTRDPELRLPIQRGVAVLLRRQNLGDDGRRWAWDYVGPSMRNDTSVSVWCALAVKSATTAGVAAGPAFSGIRRWLDATWKETNPDWERLERATGETRFPYASMADTGNVSIAPAPAAGEAGPDRADFAAAGALCALVLGSRPGDVPVETMANYVLAHQLPAAYPCNLYYVFEGTCALERIGGDRWERWKERVTRLLVDAQRRDGTCVEGSWDPPGTEMAWSRHGRYLSTAFACLSLEASSGSAKTSR